VQARLALALPHHFVLGAVFLRAPGVNGRRRPLPQNECLGIALLHGDWLHGAHVAAVCLMNSSSSLGVAGILFRQAPRVGVNAALYWHFVDAVWIAVFTSII